VGGTGKDCVQWQALVIIVLNLQILLPVSYILWKYVVRIDVRWVELTQDHIQWWDLVLAALNIWFCYQTVT